MSDVDTIAALSSLASLVGLIGLIMLFWSYQIDDFRENLFAVREDLNLYAFDQNLTNDPSCVILRQLINSLLRYAHRLNFITMVILLVLDRSSPSSDQDSLLNEWDLAVQRLDSDQQRKLHAFDDRMGSLVIKHVIKRSPLFWFFAAGTIAVRIIGGKVAASVTSIKGTIRALVSVKLLEEGALRAYPASR